MEIEKIIQYLLIGNLRSKKIIYEMQNTNDLNIIYDAKLLFNTYSKKKVLGIQNIKVDPFYINISLEKIIMISKTDISFSIDHNFQLFEKIKRNVPELIEIPFESNTNRHKQSLTSKITNIIYDYFQYVNANKQILSEAYFKIKSKNSQNIVTKNFNNNNNNKINFSRNSDILINIDNNKSINIDKSSSNRQMIFNESIKNISINQDKNLNVQNYNNFNNENVIYERDSNKLNKIILKDNIKDNNEYYNINNESPQMIIKGEQNTRINPNCCKKIIIFILILMILIKIAIIPLIIISVYSY